MHGRNHVRVAAALIVPHIATIHHTRDNLNSSVKSAEISEGQEEHSRIVAGNSAWGVFVRCQPVPIVEGSVSKQDLVNAVPFQFTRASSSLSRI